MYGKDKRARVREFKITKGILEKFGFSPHCKGCDATVFGAGARMQSEAIKNDDILKVRLDMRDIRFNRMKDEEAEERNDADVQAEKVDVEMQTDETEVASELLREKTNTINAHVLFQSPELSEPPDSQEPGGRGNHVTKRDENDTTEGEREQDNKRRRLQVCQRRL